MDPLTHMTTGVLVAQAMAPDEHRWVFALIGAGAAVVPDIDFVARKAPQSLLFVKLHRGFTHSLVSVPIIAACAAWCGQLLFDAPFMPLFVACAVAALSHITLDAIMHGGTGLQLLWPASRRLRVPLVIGLNPLTSSARCAERSLTVCLRCTMHSAIISPMVLLIWFGFTVSMLAPPYRLVSLVTLALAAAYMALCWASGLRAGALLRRALGEGSTALGAYPGSFNPGRWLGVSQRADGFEIWTIDTLRGDVRSIGRHGPSATGPEVDASRESETVQQFLENAVFPHTTAYSLDHGTRIVWQDLALAFSPVVSLYSARVDLNPGLEITDELFKERWDEAPEGNATRTISTAPSPPGAS